MLVKCVAVYKERTPKKVEVILSKVIPAKKNVIRINARVAEPVTAEIDDIFSSDISFEEENDNLSGIVPVDEFLSDDHENDIDELTDIFFEEADDLEAELNASETAADNVPFEEDISSMLSEIDAIESDLMSQLDEEDDATDESIVQRHFIRDEEGKLYEADSCESADGHEVACYDNSGRLKRACGVIRKGQPVIAPESDDDIFGHSAADMFSESDI